ncbi:glycosyltransferase family 4 protein [Candidatus Saccharibacteria bacterium]|nr:glycosyltransferase family 4 protein [Candidatus Saccharibacteria bacterium]
MQKKVFLIRNVAPNKFGGGEVYQLELAKELKAHGFLPYIITNSEELLKRAKSLGIETFTPPYIKTQNWSGAKNFLLPFYWLNINVQKRWYSGLFQAERPAIVNIQSRDDWISATMAANKLKVRTIWTDHADFRNWVLWNVDKKFKNSIGKKIVSLMPTVGKIVLISRYEKQWLQDILSKLPNNITIIRNGVLDKREQYNGSKAPKNSFVYVGRITQEKGVSELIDAFNIVSVKYPSITLNIYGDGPDLESYKKASGSNKRIVFHGCTDEPLKAIAGNEFFILPSHREGLSLSLLDAAMMQKAIIATNVGAASEVIDDRKTGLLINPNSTEDLAEAMAKVIDDRSLSITMAKNARRRYEQEFNFEQIFEKEMLPLYQEREANE